MLSLWLLWDIQMQMPQQARQPHGAVKYLGHCGLAISLGADRAEKGQLSTYKQKANIGVEKNIQFARAVLTKHYKWSGLNNRNGLSHSSRGWMCKINVSTGHAPSDGTREDSVSGLSPSSFWQFLGLWQHNPSLHMAFSLSILCLNFPFL